MRSRPGNPYPLGATWDGAGVNFALFSENATGVELCLFDGRQRQVSELARIRMTEQTDQVWHVYLPEARPGPALRLPRARPVRPGSRATASTRTSCCSIPTPRPSTGRSSGATPCSATRSAHPDADLSPRRARQRRPYVPKSVVVDPAFTWGDDRPPRIPWNETVIYEVHVKGFTARASRRAGASCGAPTPAWRARRSSTTCARWASPPWS